MRELFLGTGANGGTPQVECRCDECDAATQTRELQRLRSSVLVETSKGNIVLDCGPDFRRQLLKADLRLQDVDLIAITHLHFDHVGGLMELSAGAAVDIPVLASLANTEALWKKDYIKYLLSAKFMHFASPIEAKNMGVSLTDVPHHPQFPTSAIIINDGDNSLWYSPDVFEITLEMERVMDKKDLIIFDSTFLNEEQYPAAKYWHTTIEKSAPQLSKLNSQVVYSHINHSENPERVREYISQFGFELANDMDSRSS